MLPGAPAPPPGSKPLPPPPPAEAPPPPPAPAPLADDAAIRAEAKQLFSDGVVAYDAERYTDAIAMFEKAYKMKPHPIVLLNLAQSELKAGLREPACLHFKTWKQSAVSPTPAVVKQVNEGIKGACR